MIYELPRSDYETVRHLFSEQWDHPVIHSIIDRNNPGRIYVDDLDEPKSALVWAKYEMFYLGGDPQNEAFNNSLSSFISEQIAPEALDIGDDFFQVEMYPEAEWTQVVETLLADHLPKPYDRWDSTFHEAVYRQLPDWKDEVPAGYSVHRIDHAVLQQDKAQVAFAEVTKFWGDVDAFLEKGIGYVVMHGDEVASCCISVFVSGTHHEIGINTYRTEDRGKGLATLVARAFLDECLATGSTPHWKTEMFRVDSIRIAEKLGFEKKREYRCFYFPMRKVV